MNIRNFSIIAHIDHGKSTISDQIIKKCGGVYKINQTQILDSMELEREKGITIKAQCVSLSYKSKNNKIYQLNLIDTPGHADFSYEVLRSLSACEGALLIIDVSQGIEAQTIANLKLAKEMKLEIIPVLNKIDLITADIKKTINELKNIINIDTNKIVQCSAKTGFGIDILLESIIKNIPNPSGNLSAPLQALIIDSWFDNYFGIVFLIRIKNGIINIGDKIQIISSKKNYIVEKLGIFNPTKINKNFLKCGEVGWITCSIKNIFEVLVGDTLTLANNPAKYKLESFKTISPQIYAGIFPSDTNDYNLFFKSINKLKLNDASLFCEQENSSALGFGFRCGFLGLLHLEIIKERLKREYNLNIIITTPNVKYEILDINNCVNYIDNPSKLNKFIKIKEIREPIAECHIFSPEKYIGNIISLCISNRGIQKQILYHSNQIELIYDIPMLEIILNFYEQLKISSKGYASLNYHFKYFKISDIVRLDILINNKIIDSLSIMLHRKNVIYQSRLLIDKLQKIIPRQQFNILIQIAVGKHIIAKTIINQLRKNVIAKCYGGDISRKKKLLAKQKLGKKKMKKIGNIKLPKEIFFSLFQIKNKN